MNTDLTQIYKNYKGLWVALDGSLKNVLASGSDAKKTYEKAKKKVSIPTLFKVPENNLPYIG